MEDVSVSLPHVGHEPKLFPERRGAARGIDHHDPADTPWILKQSCNQLAPDAVRSE
jgi:hypothetical protein